MRRIVRTTDGWGLLDDAGTTRLRSGLTEILCGAPIESTGEPLGGELLAPVEDQEIWAAGVTYERSREARTEESREPDVYDRVYEAERPELFFKCTPGRVLGPGSMACIRSDSTWDVPEPEIVLVLDCRGELFGYTVGDDVSSRSIEGDNPLYLPQAKLYDGSCVIGPWIVPAADVEPPFDIELTVRRDGDVVFAGATGTSKMRRSFAELAAWLRRALELPSGALLMTGTGVVPDDSFTLAADDLVEIAAGPLGTLTHGVRVRDVSPVV